MADAIMTRPTPSALMAHIADISTRASSDPFWLVVFMFLAAFGLGFVCGAWIYG